MTHPTDATLFDDTHEPFDDGCHHFAGETDGEGRAFLGTREELETLSADELAQRELLARDALRLERLKTVLRKAKRIQVWRGIWDTAPDAPHIPFVDIQAGDTSLRLVTDLEGDGLYFQDIRATHQRGAPLFHVRDFSLHHYDLATPDGRRQAREYVRRKLKALLEV